MNSLIRNTLTILAVCLITVSSFSQETRTAKFNQGVTAFTAGNYKEALQAWTEIYNTGYRSANLDYNIGNAYFKLNDVPNAILFYERAYLLDPANEDINYNLQIARTLIVDRFQEIPEIFFIKWFNFVSLVLSTNSWAKISIISFIICLLAISLYIYTAKYKFKVLGFWMAILFFAVSLFSFAFTVRNKALVYDSHKAIIMSPQVSGKSAPDTSGTDLFVLHEGTKVTVEDRIGEWNEIRLSDGNKGWIPSGSLKII